MGARIEVKQKRSIFCNNWTIRNPKQGAKTTHLRQLVFTKWTLSILTLLKETKPVDTKKVDSDNRNVLIQRALFVFPDNQHFDGRILFICFSIWVPFYKLKGWHWEFNGRNQIPTYEDSWDWVWRSINVISTLGISGCLKSKARRKRTIL